MRVSGAAKVQWRPPRRKMGEFLEISCDLAKQLAQTRRFESRVTPTSIFATLCWFPYSTPVYRGARSRSSSISRASTELARYCAACRIPPPSYDEPGKWNGNGTIRPVQGSFRPFRSASN